MISWHNSGWWYTYPSKKYESQLGWWHYSQYMDSLFEKETHQQPVDIIWWSKWSSPTCSEAAWVPTSIQSAELVAEDTTRPQRTIGGYCAIPVTTLQCSSLQKTNWWFQILWKIIVNWDDVSKYMGKKYSKPPSRKNTCFLPHVVQFPIKCVAQGGMFE